MENRLMCRLFGFRSVITSQVHSSLVHAENNLASQSIRHPDGWGVAYYCEGTPHLIKSTNCALDDHIFKKVSGVVTSETVIAHIRKATQGQLSILNSHPFQYGKWIFAHNGNLKNFDKYKESLIKEVDPPLRRFILGTTDSEVIFFLILTEISKYYDLAMPNIPINCIVKVINSVGKKITDKVGSLYGQNDNNPAENHLTMILTNGKTMVGINGGQPLFYSTYKDTCSEKGSCLHYSRICESAVLQSEKVNHLVFSSEKLVGENIWLKIEKGDLIGVDFDMRFHKAKLGLEFT